MAIKFEKIQAGMTLFGRFRQKMGRTTMTTIVESRLKVLEVDAVSRRFRVSGTGGERWISARLASRYFDWSMYDDTVAIRHGQEGLLGRITRVTKKAVKKGAKS